MKRCLMTTCFAILAVSSALAQEKKTVPPPPKPTDEGPSLEVTMKFIQDKLNELGTVGWVDTRSDLNGVLSRSTYLIFDVVADASSCTLHAKTKKTTQTELAEGATYNEGGKAVSGDDLHHESITTSTGPFQDVDSIRVESPQDFRNRINADAGHPEMIVATISSTPAIYSLSLYAKKKDTFSFHVVNSSGKKPPQTFDGVSNGISFDLLDEDTANRLAKAMLHAVELCGGGNKEPF
jgi:hypothetical protein